MMFTGTVTPPVEPAAPVEPFQAATQVANGNSIIGFLSPARVFRFGKSLFTGGTSPVAASSSPPAELPVADVDLTTIAIPFTPVAPVAALPYGAATPEQLASASANIARLLRERLDFKNQAYRQVNDNVTRLERELDMERKRKRGDIDDESSPAKKAKATPPAMDLGGKRKRDDGEDNAENTQTPAKKAKPAITNIEGTFRAPSPSPSPSPEPETRPVQTSPGRTYGLPADFYDSDSDEEQDPVIVQKAPPPVTSSTASSAARNVSPERIVPPAPAHAPYVPPNLFGGALKHKPKTPSRLRAVQNMSPLEQLSVNQSTSMPVLDSDGLEFSDFSHMDVDEAVFHTVTEHLGYQATVECGDDEEL
jgi:hypothetical protein